MVLLERVWGAMGEHKGGGPGGAGAGAGGNPQVGCARAGSSSGLAELQDRPRARLPALKWWVEPSRYSEREGAALSQPGRVSVLEKSLEAS